MIRLGLLDTMSERTLQHRVARHGTGLCAVSYIGAWLQAVHTETSFPLVTTFRVQVTNQTPDKQYILINAAAGAKKKKKKLQDRLVSRVLFWRGE